MNEATIGQAIDELVKIIQGTQKFALTEAPDYVKQIVMNGIIEQIGWIIWGVCMLVAAGYLKKFIKTHWESDDGFVGAVGTMAFLALLGPSVFLLISSTNNLFKIWLAPKVYIVAQLRELVK